MGPPPPPPPPPPPAPVLFFLSFFFFPEIRRDPERTGDAGPAAVRLCRHVGSVTDPLPSIDDREVGGGGQRAGCRCGALPVDTAPSEPSRNSARPLAIPLHRGPA